MLITNSINTSPSAMSEFPEIQGFETPTDAELAALSEKDLASREKELLGAEGAAEFGNDDDFADSAFIGATEIVSNGAEDSTEGTQEIPTDDFNTSNADEESVTPNVSSLNFGSQPGAGPSAYVPQDVDLRESEFLKDWEVKRDLEIERRDKVSKEIFEDNQEKAHKAIDDFYENYNSKKEKEIAEVRETAAEFEKKRDADSSSQGTTWSIAARLIEGLGSPVEGIEPADKKRFYELIETLKNDPKAPGAAGY